MAQVGGQELRDVVVTGIGPVFLLEETRERWNRAEERERDIFLGILGMRDGLPINRERDPLRDGVQDPVEGAATG
nr:hypothetical protein [uncultured Mediterranean phage uvMED]